MVRSNRRGGRRKKEALAKARNVDRVRPANGNALSNHDLLRRLYASMLKCRMLVEQAQHLSGNHSAGADYDFAVGREAVVIGATLGLGREDTIAVPPGDFAAHFANGASLKYLLSRAGRQDRIQVATLATGPYPRATVCFDPFNLGTGLALAHRLEKKRTVVVALCAREASPPDGGREAMKFAGIHKLPIIYVKSASALEYGPGNRNPALEELSFMARDCGFPAIIVDGNDAVAVWRVAQESIHRARNGAGPTLIECETHALQASDPLAQMEQYMRRRGVWDEVWRQDTGYRIKAEIERAAALVGK
jgi:TPP-dependent pyruvate/acetoin dehydrogenase alpha subunit